MSKNKIDSKCHESFRYISDSSVTLGKLFDVSDPQFPLWKMRMIISDIPILGENCIIKISIKVFYELKDRIQVLVNIIFVITFSSKCKYINKNKNESGRPRKLQFNPQFSIEEEMLHFSLKKWISALKHIFKLKNLFLNPLNFSYIYFMLLSSIDLFI